MSEPDDELFRTTLAAVAPGTVLRDGLERILRGNTGALVVLGHDKLVESLSTGGFDINIEFSATRLRELAKMDGAVVVDGSVSRIIKAAVQLVPDPSIETLESGTRHRTAERVARQTGYPVVSVSQSMHIIALYVDGRRHVLRTTPELVSQANQAMQTLERYTNRLNEVTGSLSALEIEDLVTVRDVAVVLQRLEMVRRIHAEIAEYVLELGVDGRLLTLQLEELTAGLDDDLHAVILDYLDPEGPVASSQGVLDNLSALDATELLDLGHVAKSLGFPIVGESLDASVSPRGLRILGKIPRLPGAIVERLVGQFGSLQRLLAAGIDDLMTVDGVGELRARTVREGLSRLAESSILERYV
ncbi:DNA integrity scanning diadenylate cyclase DisA [Janibacter sp. LM]|uniref:DNA integrity scanning diadenylate cyclase DisA n=1 Tax=Janibacter sp. LM TaxID=3144845 RepID=UPI0031F64318